ncbi:hypothetical protein [Gordonia sp. NPDC003376]
MTDILPGPGVPGPAGRTHGKITVGDHGDADKSGVVTVRGLGIWVVMVAIGLLGVVWAVVDVVNRGWGDVPGSTWLCAILGAILAVFALYREFGGEPLVTVDHENVAEEYEEQKRQSRQARDGE